MYRLRIETIEAADDDALITVDKVVDEDVVRYVLTAMIHAESYKASVAAAHEMMVRRADERLELSKLREPQNGSFK